MILCARCRSERAITSENGVELCYVCARAMNVVGPAYLGQSPVEQAGFFEDVPGPYAMGKKMGESMKEEGVGDTMREGAKAVSKTADTIKTVAIAGAILGVAALGYVLYKGVKMQAQAAHSLAEHPELLKLAV